MERKGPMFDKGQKKNPPPWRHTQRKFTVAHDKKVDTIGYAYFPQRTSWTQISRALYGGSSPSYKIFASVRTKIIHLIIVGGI
jgi:hypothetical protein